MKKRKLEDAGIVLYLAAALVGIGVLAMMIFDVSLWTCFGGMVIEFIMIFIAEYLMSQAASMQDPCTQVQKNSNP